MLRKNEELQIQAAIVRYLRIQGGLVFAVPNGTFIQNAFTRRLWQSSGLFAGVSDLVAVFKNQIFFIEVKTKKGSQSIDQKNFQSFIEGFGFKYVLLRSLDEAVYFFKDNIKNKK